MYIPAAVVKFDEDRAYTVFCFLRWPDSHGTPECVRCGHKGCWEIRRKRFKCEACRREFSVATGTVFAFRNAAPRHPDGAVVLGELGQGQERAGHDCP
ncbi:transposase [Rhizobium sp. BK176]|uniref:transposase n=1 Tax=Rhizobium sp. BK176 TaxID=2587071 RepID=UPI003867F68E